MNQIIENIVNSVTEYTGNEKYEIKVAELIGACKHECYKICKTNDNFDQFNKINADLICECIEYVRHNLYDTEFDDWDRALELGD